MTLAFARDKTKLKMFQYCLRKLMKFIFLSPEKMKNTPNSNLPLRQYSEMLDAGEIALHTTKKEQPKAKTKQQLTLLKPIASLLFTPPTVKAFI
ncbi:hypothetical protein CEXT_795011 [Caerostris extrusa]|uniref:Uncharacterized protein n=1 Tax=Caerostris extrusa TaxID=172846 RepID=A0AAV4RX94_CAEEX|nr:hypothetical protein CEXT_795011 [Caerostris extrusa]